ncbi:hypothetical protein GmHk_06G016194 [Glycine max]|nr:hypothetical protein GmHk_06G016194 [Glycine max]
MLFYYGAYGGGGGGMTRSRKKGFPKFMVKRGEEFHQIKCNVDSSFHMIHNITRIGLCVRDDQGRLVLAMTSWRQPYMNVQEVAMNFNNVLFELDCKMIVDKINIVCEDLIELKNIIVKQNNKVVHELIRITSLLPSFYSIDHVILCNEHLIHNEMR